MSLSEQDKMHVLLLSRIGAVEGMLMLALRDHPNKEEIRKDAEFLTEANIVISLNQAIDEEEQTISQRGRKQALHAVFPELAQQG